LIIELVRNPRDEDMIEMYNDNIMISVTHIDSFDDDIIRDIRNSDDTGENVKLSVKQIEN